MDATCDVLIVGAGIIGLAVGERLVSSGFKRVWILEKEPMPATGSTGRSAGGIRQQFEDPHKVRAAHVGFSVYDTFQDRYGVDPEFKKHGYLILRSTEEGAMALKAGVERQQALGLPTELLTPEGVKARIPALNTHDLTAGSFNATDGYLDPHALVKGFQAAFKREGGGLFCGEAAQSLVMERGRVIGVLTSKRTIHAGAVVIAPGPHAELLLAPVGVHLPLRTCRRQIFVTGSIQGVAPEWPLILDVDAPFYFRPEGPGVIMSFAEMDEIPPPREGNDIPQNRKSLPLLAEKASHRCPILENAEIVNSWAGLRTLTPDERPILGPVNTLDQLCIAVGFSGHGITLAPFAAEFLLGELTGKPLGPDLRNPFLSYRFQRP
ncbi:MAG: FAD-binding oxidoreductase [Planctomycetota bacterium]